MISAGSASIVFVVIGAAKAGLVINQPPQHASAGLSNIHGGPDSSMSIFGGNGTDESLESVKTILEDGEDVRKSLADVARREKVIGHEAGLTKVATHEFERGTLSAAGTLKHNYARDHARTTHLRNVDQSRDYRLSNSLEKMKTAGGRYRKATEGIDHLDETKRIGFDDLTNKGKETASKEMERAKRQVNMMESGRKKDAKRRMRDAFEALPQADAQLLANCDPCQQYVDDCEGDFEKARKALYSEAVLNGIDPDVISKAEEAAHSRIVRRHHPSTGDQDQLTPYIGNSGNDDGDSEYIAFEDD